MMNQTESFGVRLAQLRRDAGLSQQELAQALSVTRQAVSNWERDQTAPDLDMLLSITAALGTDPNTLCGVSAVPRQRPRRSLLRPALALSLCAAFCLGAGLGLWSSRTPPEPVPDATFSTTLSTHRISYTTPSGIKVTTAADGALEVSDELAALPEQDPGPVELTAQLRDDFSYFARQYILRFLPDYQNGAFLSDWDDVLLWCYRSGCSGGDIMEPHTVADYLARFFGYEGELPAQGTEQFPLKSGVLPRVRCLYHLRGRLHPQQPGAAGGRDLPGTTPGKALRHDPGAAPLPHRRRSPPPLRPQDLRFLTCTAPPGPFSEGPGLFSLLY